MYATGALCGDGSSVDDRNYVRIERVLGIVIGASNCKAVDSQPFSLKRIGIIGEFKAGLQTERSDHTTADRRREAEQVREPVIENGIYDVVDIGEGQMKIERRDVAEGYRRQVTGVRKPANSGCSCPCSVRRCSV